MKTGGESMKRYGTGFRASGRVVALWALLLAAAVCNGGCLNKGATANNAGAAPAAGAPVKNADRYKVTADTTPFYHYGPQQLNGSDEDLKKDTRITMLNRGRGYSQIRLASNETGYVGTEDISPLSAQEIATEDAQKLAAATAAAATASANAHAALNGNPGGPAYTIPPEAGNSESLPMRDANPTPTPPPPSMFHY